MQPSGLTRSLTADQSGDLTGDSDPDEPEATGAPEMDSNPSLDRQPTDETPEVPAMQPETQPAMEPEMETLTDQMIAEADQTLQRFRALILPANCKEMKSASEAALEQRMTDDQQNQAQALFELADLATYYRVGIEKAVSELKVGNDFEVTEEVRVIVVETGPDLLVIRFNAKNKSYSFDQLPWSLAHKLATFTMPSDDPTVQAAKAVYQALSPSASDEYRDQALQMLNEIQSDGEGADPQQLAETIRSLFEES